MLKCMRTDHANEILLLGIIAAGVILLLVLVIQRGIEGWDVAACLLVLQAIISAIKERWTQRSVDRMGDQLATSTPRPQGPAPRDAAEAAGQVADAAETEAERIAGEPGR